MTREEALKKAIIIVSYFEAHFAKSKEAREDAVNIIEALEQEPREVEAAKLQQAYIKGFEDCRQAVRNTIFTECSSTKLDIDFAKVLLLQRAIKALLPIIPQESKMQEVEK